jgi:hypothetical protein
MSRLRSTPATSRPSARHSRAASDVLLPGQHIPQPGAWRLHLQLSVLLAVALCASRSSLQAWAADVLEAQATLSGAASPGDLALLPEPEALLAQGLLAGFSFLGVPLRMITAAGLLVLAVELALFVVWRVIADMRLCAAAGRGGTTLLVRLPPPGRPVGGGSAVQADVGDELFDSLHSVLRGGGAGWRGVRLAFSLLGRPQAPSQALVWMPNDTSSAQGDGTMVGRLRPILEGILPGTRADMIPDPLRAAIHPGKQLHWSHVTLVAPPSCPLRMAENLEHDLMGPLANAHRARPGTDVITLHVILEPLRDTLLRAAWKGEIMRRLMRLEGRFEHHLDADTKRLQAKLAGAPYRATITAIAVGDDSKVVQHDLDALLATLEGQYRQTTGDTEQRLIRREGGSFTVPEDWDRLVPQRRLALWVSVGALVGLATGLIISAQLAALLGVLAAAWRAALPELARSLQPVAPGLLLPPLLTAGLTCAGALIGCVVLRARCADATRQQLARLLARAPRPPLPPRLLLPALEAAPQGILTAREIEGLWDLPGAQLAGVVETLPCRYIPPPMVAFCNGETDRVPIGLGRRADGSYAAVGPTLRDLRNIMHMTAAMGTGKSRLLTNICHHLMRMPGEVGFGLIDGKGDDQGALAYTVLDLVPLEAEGRLVWVDLLDQLNPIGLNPLASDLTDQDENLVLNQLLVMFARLDPSSWTKSHGMEQYAQQAGLLVLEAVDHPTLAHFKQALVSEEYREQLLRRVRNPEVVSFWKEVFPSTGENQKSSRDALIRRVDKLLVSPMLRNIFTRPVPTLNIRAAMETGQIVLIPLPSERLGGMARGIGSLLIREFVKGAFARSGSDVDRRDWPLIADELQVLIDPLSNVDLETVLTRFRALGVPGLYAHQTLGQLGELASEMVGNVMNHIILRANEPDASFYAKLYASQSITPADISGQPALEHQYADLVCRGQPTRLFSYQPLMWPAPPHIELPPYDGPAWRSVRAPARGATEQRLDDLIARLALLSQAARYDPLDVASNVARTLSGDEWAEVKARWLSHRLAQREHILANPGCIPDHRERRVTVSVLRSGEPRLAAMVDYLRVRQTLSGRVAIGVRPKEQGGADTAPRAGEPRRLQGAIGTYGEAEGTAGTARAASPPVAHVERSAAAPGPPVPSVAAPAIEVRINEEPVMEVQDG